MVRHRQGRNAGSGRIPRLARFGKRVVFEYRIGSVGIEDEAGNEGCQHRRIDLKDAGESLAALPGDG